MSYQYNNQQPQQQNKNIKEAYDMEDKQNIQNSTQQNQQIQNNNLENIKEVSEPSDQQIKNNNANQGLMGQALLDLDVDESQNLQDSAMNQSSMEHWLILENIRKQQSYRTVSDEEKMRKLRILQLENHKLREKTKNMNDKLNGIIETQQSRKLKTKKRKRAQSQFKKETLLREIESAKKINNLIDKELKESEEWTNIEQQKLEKTAKFLQIELKKRFEQTLFLRLEIGNQKSDANQKQQRYHPEKYNMQKRQATKEVMLLRKRFETRTKEREKQILQQSKNSQKIKAIKSKYEQVCRKYNFTSKITSADDVIKNYKKIQHSYKIPSYMKRTLKGYRSSRDIIRESRKVYQDSPRKRQSQSFLGKYISQRLIVREKPNYLNNNTMFELKNSSRILTRDLKGGKIFNNQKINSVKLLIQKVTRQNNIINLKIQEEEKKALECKQEIEKQKSKLVLNMDEIQAKIKLVQQVGKHDRQNPYFKQKKNINKIQKYKGKIKFKKRQEIVNQERLKADWIGLENIKKAFIGKPNLELEQLDDRKRLGTNYNVTIIGVKVWIGKENDKDKNDNICGVQFFYQDLYGKIYKGISMVKEQSQYKVQDFMFDKDDYLIKIEGSQSLERQRHLIQLDYKNQASKMSFIRFITKKKKAYEIGKRDGRLLKIGIEKNCRPICMRVGLRILYTYEPKTKYKNNKIINTKDKIVIGSRICMIGFDYGIDQRKERRFIRIKGMQNQNLSKLMTLPKKKEKKQVRKRSYIENLQALQKGLNDGEFQTEDMSVKVKKDDDQVKLEVVSGFQQNYIEAQINPQKRNK